MTVVYRVIFRCVSLAVITHPSDMTAVYSSLRHLQSRFKGFAYFKNIPLSPSLNLHTRCVSRWVVVERSIDFYNLMYTFNVIVHRNVQMHVSIVQWPDSPSYCSKVPITQLYLTTLAPYFAVFQQLLRPWMTLNPRKQEHNMKNNFENTSLLKLVNPESQQEVRGWKPSYGRGENES